jgi:hypothetical protein
VHITDGSKIRARMGVDHVTRFARGSSQRRGCTRGARDRELVSEKGGRVAHRPPLRTFDADKHRKYPLAAWLPDLLGRAERSSSKAASRRAEGAGLDGQGRGPSYHLPAAPAFPMRRTPPKGCTCAQV